MTSTINSQAGTDPRRSTNTRQGVVVSDKRDKTRTVRVEFQFRHPKYGKYLKRHSRFHVDDPKNQSRLGDQVEIANCRPISKTKSWRLVRVLKSSSTLDELRIPES